MSVMCDKAGMECSGKLWVSFSIDVSIKVPSPIWTGWNRILFGYPYASSLATHGIFTVLFNLKIGLNILAFGCKTEMFSVTFGFPLNTNISAVGFRLDCSVQG